jgi:hypothetical protein
MAEPEPLAKDDRPIAYVEGHRPVYRASACGGCLRALVAARLGFDPVEPPEFLATAAREGERLESFIVEDLERDGWRVSGRQEPIEVEFPAFVIRGHIDGVAEREDAGPRLLEVKTMSRRRFEQWRRHGFAAFPRYAAQASVYHHAMGLPLLYAVRNRDTGETDVRLLPSPPLPFDQVKRKLLEAEVWARKGRMPSCDYQPGSMERRVCPYAYLCDGGDAKEEAKAAGVILDWNLLAIREWARRYVAAREQEMAAAALKDEAREQIVHLLGGEAKVDALGYKVSLTKRVRRGLDTARLEADFGQALDPYRTTTEYTALTVTPPKAEST